MTTYVIPLIIIFILILLNGLFVAAEFALVTAPRPQLNKRARQGSAVAKSLLTIVSNPDLQNRYITTAQVGITVASLGLGMYGEHVIAEWFIEPLHHLGFVPETLVHTISFVISVSILTYLHVVIGEMIPKSFALQTASNTIIALYRPLRIAERIFYPIVQLMNSISLAIIHRIGLSTGRTSTRLFTPQDLEFIVGESRESGLLEETDRIFIENILDMDERVASQIMTPRNRIFAMDIKKSFPELIQFICETNKTRYPIYEETPDNIIGVLHIKDLARWQIINPDAELQIPDIIRPIFFVPETYPLSELLVKFRQERSQIAVALDEFGGTAGIITFEDLIEEVVGEILDEFDQEIPPIEELAPGVIRVRGDVILDEITQHYDLRFDENIESYSIGGYIMSKLGTIPQPNDMLNLGDYTIIVEKVENRAVISARIRFTIDN